MLCKTKVSSILMSIGAYAMFPQILSALQFFVGKFWGHGSLPYADGTCFDACFVPKTGINETL